MRRSAALALLGALACASPPGSAPAPASDGRYAMGTVLEATLYAARPDDASRALEEIFALAARFDGLMSVYAADSDVSLLNRSAGSGPRRVDPEVARVVAASLAYSRLTRGSFDVTVGPLVALWTRAAERGELPAPAERAAALRRVGSEKVRVDAEGRVALEAGVSLDLGGVAKGYALDRMLPLLRERGIGAALLSFGQSSAWALGHPPDAAGWRLLVRGPGDAPLGVVTLRDQALSVSGSLGQWVEIGGQVYGHVVDPRSGWPLTRRRQAVVVAPDAALAEALSKALLIEGEGAGLSLVAAQPGCQGLLADADGGLWSTPGWARAVSFERL